MSDTTPTFEQLGLSSKLLKALEDVGYEVPSPIQAMSIPPLLQGRDIIGQAQTGTGKTAAFALPILQNLEIKQKDPQVLVLAPTRELAIQVAEAFQTYAHHMKGFHILPVYGGQGYDTQLRALKRGVHIIVGTPGRVMDHMRKGVLNLDGLTHLVLDEADEMLRMGFIDDVEWVMERTPKNRQIALFSATMPDAIAKVAKKYLNDPVLVKIETKTSTADTIRQRYWSVTGGINKLEAITRILEAEPFEAMIIFVRTKTATVELAERLEARGYRACALNGDISQNLRERTITRLKAGQIDILVATDVAARGLDVDRISHVLNYDIPYDTESYVHRIGRTGRAGRSGQAILFVAKREVRMLKTIERATGKEIEPMILPSAADINVQRISKFKQKISETLAEGDLNYFRNLITEHMTDTGDEALEIAAALAKLCQGDQPLLLADKKMRERDEETDFSESRPPRDRERQDRAPRDREPRERESREREPREREPREREAREPRDRSSRERVQREINVDERSPRDKVRRERSADIPMDTYRVSVGRNDGVKPGDLVGAIANEAGMDSQHIGHIKIHDDYCTVDLPTGMPKEIHQILQRVWVCQKQLKLALMSDKTDAATDSGKRPEVNFSKPKRGPAADKPPRKAERVKSPSKGRDRP